MEEIPLPTEADLHAEAAALAPPPEWRVRSWEDLGETLEGRLSGLKALRAAARAEAYRLCHIAGQPSRRAGGPRLSTSSSSRRTASIDSSREAPACAEADVAAALMSLADNDAPFLLSFLRHAKFHTPAAVGRLREFAAFLVSNPWALSPDRALVERVYGGDAPLLTLMPAPATDGERVFLLYAKRINGMTVADLTSINRASFWALCGLLRQPAAQLGGVCFLDDMDGLGFGILRLVGSEQNRFGWRMMQTVLPLRLRGIHVYREPGFFSLLWAIAKTVINRKVRARMRVYGNNSEALVKSLGAGAVPKTLGGSAEVTPDMSVNAVMEVVAHTPWLGTP